MCAECAYSKAAQAQRVLSLETDPMGPDSRMPGLQLLDTDPLRFKKKIGFKFPWYFP